MFFALCAVMIPLEYFLSGKENRKLSLKNNYLNIVYWFFNPLFIRPMTNVVLIIFLFLLSSLLPHHADAHSFFDGFGPVVKQPVWLQILEILLLADLIEYWVHRVFHQSRFWKIHAVHHSAEEMNWLASARMHPINDLCTKVCQVVPLVAVGFPISSAALVVPYLFLYVIFLHSNIKCDFGIFKYLIVSPAYHHWHHSSETAALDKNFAGIFPVWDIIFGTLYLPEHRASSFGVIRDAPPEDLLGQMVYPFKKSNLEQDSSVNMPHAGTSYPQPLES